MAGKSNTSFSQIDKSSFFFAQKCGACHPGGGALELDRDGHRYFDEKTGKFGHQLSGRDPKFDGDYTSFSGGNPNFGAPWDKTGVVEADCLLCHLKGYAFGARKAALNGRKFREAPAVGAGWAKAVMGTDATGVPMVKEVAIDYSRKEIADPAKLGDAIVRAVPAKNCWACHTVSDQKKRGRTLDPEKDIHVKRIGSCLPCHPSDAEHNFAKGDGGVETARDDLDFTMPSCADCHLSGKDKKAPYPARHSFPPRHYALIACASCHIPHLEDAAQLLADNATSGVTIEVSTAGYLKFDDQAPNRWRPALKLHRGKIRPFKELVAIWWGDLNEKTGMVRPIPLWKVRDWKKPDLADDNGDGKPELNSAGEVKAFLASLKGAKDKFGEPLVQGTPALMKGGHVYKLAADGSVAHYEDVQAESHGFTVSHNVQAASAAIGAKGCAECHAKDSPFFTRKVLVDPYGEDGKPVFEPTWKLMGLSESRLKKLETLDTSGWKKK